MIFSALIFYLLLASIQEFDSSIARIRTLGERGEMAQAEGLVREILAQPQGSSKQRALYQTALTWMREFHFDAAVWMFERFWEASPSTPQVWLNYGISLKVAGRYEESEDIFQKGREKFPKEGSFQNEIGLLYQAQGKDALAEKSFKEACQLGVWAGAENLAVLQRLRKDSPRDRDLLKKVLRSDSSRPWGRQIYGLTRLDGAR